MTVTGPVVSSVATARDLDTRADIHDLVVAYYQEIVFDTVPGRQDYGERS